MVKSILTILFLHIKRYFPGARISTDYKHDEIVKSPLPSLRGAERRGNLSAIQWVMSLPWRDMPESIEVDGDSYDFTLESEVSLPGLGQGLPQ